MTKKRTPEQIEKYMNQGNVWSGFKRTGDLSLVPLAVTHKRVDMQALAKAKFDAKSKEDGHDRKLL